MAGWFLGVDGGQSSTTALIGDDGGRIVGYGRGGPCNHAAAAPGRARFTAAIRSCLSQACAQAGLDPNSVRFASACLGFSGGPADKQDILNEILRCDRMTVTHDALIALAGATGGAPGLIVIAGTGSIAFGRNAAGTTARAGGWGYLFGDEGGAFDIVRQALRAALRFEEGWGPPTSLRQVFLDATSAGNINDALHCFYTADFPRDRIAGIAPAVNEAAVNGDQVAIGILEAAAQALAMLASAVRRQLFPPGAAARASYIGGAFRSAPLLERFRFLTQLEEGNTVAPPLYDPAAGALLEAYAAAEMRVALSNAPGVEKI